MGPGPCRPSKSSDCYFQHPSSLGPLGQGPHGSRAEGLGSVPSSTPPPALEPIQLQEVIPRELPEAGANTHARRGQHLLSPGFSGCKVTLKIEL